MPRSERPRRPYRPPYQDPLQEVMIFHQEIVRLHNNGISIASMALNYVKQGGICDRQQLLAMMQNLNTHVQVFKSDIDKLGADLNQTNSHINGNDRHAKALELGMQYQNLIGIWSENVLPLIAAIQSVIQPPMQGVVNV